MAQLEREIMIDATPETIFPLLTTTEGMLRWEGTEGEIDARPGGVYRILVGGRAPRARRVRGGRPQREGACSPSAGTSPGNPITPGSTEVEITLHPGGLQDARAPRAPRAARRRRLRPHPGLGPLPRPPGRGGRRRRPRARRHAAGLTPGRAATEARLLRLGGRGRRRGRRLGGRGGRARAGDGGRGDRVVGARRRRRSWRSTSRRRARCSTSCVVLSSGLGRSRSSGGSGKSSTLAALHRHGHEPLPDLRPGSPPPVHAVHRRAAPGGPPTRRRRSRARSRRTRRRRCPGWCRSCRPPAGRCRRPCRCRARSRPAAPR